MALTAAQQLAPERLTIEPFELHGIPPFNQDDEQNAPPPVRAFKDAIRAADAVLIATPEYNYGVPGVLKNAIDWASRPYGDNAFAGKPVAMIGASISKFGTIRAQVALRQSFIFLEMAPLPAPEVFIAEAQRKFDASGNLTDEATQQVLRQFLEKFQQWINRLREPAHAQ
jgi:chromate reductase